MAGEKTGQAWYTLGKPLFIGQGRCFTTRHVRLGELAPSVQASEGIDVGLIYPLAMTNINSELENHQIHGKTHYFNDNVQWLC